VSLLGHDIALPEWARPALRELPVGEVRIGVRPTDIGITPDPIGGGPTGQVNFVESLGAETYLTVVSGDLTLICRAPGRLRLEPGDAVGLNFDPDYVYAFDPATGSAILDRSARRGTIEIDRTRRVSADL
jgi:ABC-type sugar transport system ATPase subunit